VKPEASAATPWRKTHDRLRPAPNLLPSPASTEPYPHLLVTSDSPLIRVQENWGRLNATPQDRGHRVLDALHVWLAADRSLRCGINRFEVRVAENGDTWIERLRW
ncbi:MAG: hypothetical protein OXG35_26635, partial [Acidobacteria bacterium]|nr:hypothetical protein [Acidobacteriota bacterium]